MICKTCRHWTPPAERDDFGDVIRIVPPGSYQDAEVNAAARQAQHDADLLFGRCGVIRLREIDLGEPIPLAVAMDGSEYVANVYTQAEFGCAMWEAKP